MTQGPPQSHPEQKPPSGLANLLDQMKSQADDVIRQAATSSAPVERRQRDGIFEVFAVIRPRFGPANAALFNARDQKLLELARALGVEDPMPPDVDGHRLDQFFDTLERVSDALRSRGLDVETLPATSSAILRTPAVQGRMLRATDPTRTLPEYVPYAELMPERPAPKNVSPRLTLYLFPPARMTASQGMMTREQPGNLVGALEGACVFTLQAPQSGDTDDGKTETKVLESLFPGAQSADQPKAAAALGGQSADELRGVLRVSAQAPPPEALPGSVELPAGTEAVLWSVAQGSNIQHTLLPAR